MPASVSKISRVSASGADNGRLRKRMPDRIGTTGRSSSWSTSSPTRHTWPVWRVGKRPWRTPARGVTAGGAPGTRKKHSLLCPRCHYHAHADANAAQHIRDWYGLCCPLVLEAPADGAHGMPLSTVRDTASLWAGVDQESETLFGTG